MIYSIIIIVLSLYLGKHFEAPFKQIINNIKNLMLKNSIDKVTPEFFIKEFTFLQKVITDAFEYRDEQDKQRLIFERERINREIERVQEQNALKEEQLKLESQINETKLLQLKNEAFQAAIAEQQKFRGIVGQMVHDIGSPLATLQTIMQSATGLPENERIALREAAISITDITNNMLNRFNPTHSTSENDVPQHILIYAALSQAISQKRYQYKDLPIQFEFQIDEADGNVKLSHEAENSNFAFIKIEPNAFKRMLSNLINNAVDALDKKPGNITLKLNADKEWITIRLCDTGKGISPEIQQKIMNNMQVTEGKENGHGIGMMQIRETLSRNYAEFFIDSEVGKGTIITLKFPRITAPNWIATEIKVTPKDTLVILDDEASIHKAWDTRFKAMLEANPTLQIKHFSAGEEAVNFINSLTSDEKQNIYLLTDYELLGQKLNGLQVIEQVELGRCVLVTSHYADPKLHSAAGKIGIKILPKDLAHNIKIQVEQKFELQSKQVDLVVIEDVRIFIDSIVQTHYKDMKVDVYYDPISFLENVDQYPLNTRMIIDSTYNYDGNEYDINGFDVALKLHEKGYTKLYLFTSDNYREELLPPYLKYLNKLDREVVKNLHKL
ncbi:MAG: HAMP domain-containing histidine kinase [Burkholderiales bacterium]|nr:HAMP domain-containing histidine kinase [Burkholderiales bacterium]